VTHTGKRAGGDNGIKRIKDLILVERKWLKRLASQYFETIQSFGKDEVPGPNPGSSSRKILRTFRF